MSINTNVSHTMINRYVPITSLTAAALKATQKRMGEMKLLF